MFRGWPVALRLAHRTARRSPGRTALIATLIGLPVMASSWAAIIISTANPSGEALAREVTGTADAAVQMTTYERVVIEPFMLSDDTIGHRPADERAPTRDIRTVDLDELLPAGTRSVVATNALATMHNLKVRDAVGTFGVSSVVGDDPLTAGTFRLDAGRMPTAPDEVALSESAAEALELLDGDSLVPDAAITTAEGKSYGVVGLARAPAKPESEVIWATPQSPLLDAVADIPVKYLLDLPEAPIFRPCSSRSPHMASC